MFKVRTDVVLALSILADQDLIQQALTTASTNSIRFLSFRGTWSLKGGTAGEGPIHVGISHGDYTAAEVEEWFEQTAAIDRDNKIAVEQSNRLVRHVGTFSGQSAAEVLNDGRPILTRLNWAVVEGRTLNFWAYNDFGTALTGGASVIPIGHVVGRTT